MKTTNVKNNYIIKIRYINKIQYTKIHKNYNKLYFYKCCSF